MSRIKLPQPVQGEDGWISHFSTRRLPLASGIDIEVNEGLSRNDPGYHVSFLGWELKGRLQTLPGAKAAGLRLARRVLDKATARLAEIEKEMGK